MKTRNENLHKILLETLENGKEVYFFENKDVTAFAAVIDGKLKKLNWIKSAHKDRRTEPDPTIRAMRTLSRAFEENGDTVENPIWRLISIEKFFK